MQPRLRGTLHTSSFRPIFIPLLQKQLNTVGLTAVAVVKAHAAKRHAEE